MVALEIGCTPVAMYFGGGQMQTGRRQETGVLRSGRCGLYFVVDCAKKTPRRSITVVPPTVKPDEVLYVVSFDGSARVKHGGGACSAIV